MPIQFAWQRGAPRRGIEGGRREGVGQVRGAKLVGDLWTCSRKWLESVCVQLLSLTVTVWLLTVCVWLWLCVCVCDWHVPCARFGPKVQLIATCGEQTRFSFIHSWPGTDSGQRRRLGKCPPPPLPENPPNASVQPDSSNVCTVRRIGIVSASEIEWVVRVSHDQWTAEETA